MRAKAIWRDPALGEQRELDLPHGRLRYFVAGSGPPIVFVHGYFVNANLWRKVVPKLAQEFRCVALDLPFGSHALPMDRDADLGEQGLIDLILGAIAALRLDDVTLVGMDTGGAICQFIVAQQPDRIDRLVLCSCDYRDNFPPRRFTHLRWLPAVAPLTPVVFAPMRFRAPRRLPNAFGSLVHNQVERRVEDTWILPALDDRRVRADVMKALGIFDTRRLNEAAENLHRFDKPTLIAWSRDDRVFPPDHGERLARELPNARLEWIEGARTFSMEDQPERLAGAITRFMRETAKAAA
jgi:pimeloyl-ACP methyl ester carboxylesterase